MAKTVTAKKRLGQHFLVDLTVAKNIADTVDVAPELPILEVGPGMGVLTRMLLEKKRTLKVVEIDGYKLLDGGMTSSIPLKLFEDLGYSKNIVILTHLLFPAKIKQAILMRL